MPVQSRIFGSTRTCLPRTILCLAHLNADVAVEIGQDTHIVHREVIGSRLHFLVITGSALASSRRQVPTM
jgi:hypothetical protein